MHDVADPLVVTAERLADLVGGLATGAGQHDLAAAEDTGVRRPQAGLHGLTLVIRTCLDTNRRSHVIQATRNHSVCLADILARSPWLALAYDAVRTFPNLRC